MNDSKKTGVEIVNLSELYPDLGQGMPVTPKLRTLLRQMSMGIDVQKIVEHNPYLARLMTECQLLFPEMFNKKLNQYWDYQVAWQFEGGWLESLLDLVAMQDYNMLIIDWSGLEVNEIATAQAYILSQQLKLPPNKISIISLLTNDLKADLRICFSRRRIFTNDLVVCEQELGERLALLHQGKDLRLILSEQESETEFNLLTEIEGIPEISID
ncbi:hypothetical protein C7B62_20825 [Pleurocapsa sp. CCALA 161]|uniref:hypothetical protein n=1 Tax=Pleurocapsa sp. CCALA 161 TaxID=2107688 RepID=UPI000D06A43B|nr:hypothetical protein [Pleurocapsa sp. CCALA 161]PSB07115.1 hypothetical protein C7B62_20825 [Pleurocapsa sp. CCALA 161]